MTAWPQCQNQRQWHIDSLAPESKSASVTHWHLGPSVKISVNDSLAPASKLASMTHWRLGPSVKISVSDTLTHWPSVKISVSDSLTPVSISVNDSWPQCQYQRQKQLGPSVNISVYDSLAPVSMSVLMTAWPQCQYQRQWHNNNLAPVSISSSMTDRPQCQYQCIWHLGFSPSSLTPLCLLGHSTSFVSEEGNRFLTASQPWRLYQDETYLIRTQFVSNRPSSYI